MRPAMALNAAAMMASTISAAYTVARSNPLEDAEICWPRPLLEAISSAPTTPSSE